MRTFIGGLVIGSIVGLIAGGFTVAVIMGGAIMQLQ